MKYIKYVSAVLFYLVFDNSFFAGFVGFFVGIFINFKLSGGLLGKLSGFGNVGGVAGIKTQKQRIFFETVFTLMGKLAKADGRVSEIEIAHVEKFMAQLNMSPANRKEAIQHFQSGAKPDYDIDLIITKFLSVTETSQNLTQMLMIYLLRVAAADGELNPKETELLRRIAQKVGYSEQQLAQLMAMLQGQDQFAGGHYQHQHGGSASNYRSIDAVAAAYQALGVSKEDSDSDIKKAYRKLVREYHPDKLMGQGLPEAMIKEATERSQEIQTAYDTIKKSRGI